MRDSEKPPDARTVTRTVLSQAMEYLIARYSCSTDEARERIQREAMVKRASLDEVARAILVGEAVSYRPNVPSRSEFVR
jgi:AmiR/NasT family two-component response regulator